MAYFGRLVSSGFVGEYAKTLEKQLLEHLLSRRRLFCPTVDLALEAIDVFLGQLVELFSVHDPVSRENALATATEESPVVGPAVVVVQEQLNPRAIPAVLTKRLLSNSMAHFHEPIDPVGKQLPRFDELHFLFQKEFHFLKRSEAGVPRLKGLTFIIVIFQFLFLVELKDSLLSSG